MNLKVLVGRCWQGKKRQILGFLLLCVEKKDRPGNGQQTTNDVGGNVVLQNMVVGCRVCAGVDEGGRWRTHLFSWIAVGSLDKKFC